MNAVFVLGAGASADARVPLMPTFFERANLIPRSDDSAFQLVAKGRSRLQLAQSKAQLDIRNLESVFAAFEMARLFGRLGDLTPEECEQLPNAMSRMIVTTIGHYMMVRVRNGRIHAPERYGEFGSLVKSLKGQGHSVSVITFNYDIGVELGLATNGLEADYCLREEPLQPREKLVDLMKLHGSLNWSSCRKCHTDIAWRRVIQIIMDTEAKWREENSGPGDTTNHIPLWLLEPLRDTVCTCEPRNSDPMIIPPTPNKSSLHQELRTVWKKAAARLSEADNIFVIGYSWPDTDHFFHQLFALGTVGNTILSRFWVHDINEDVRKKFQQKLLGQQALDCFGPPNAPSFSEAINTIAGQFGLGAPTAPNRWKDKDPITGEQLRRPDEWLRT